MYVGQSFSNDLAFWLVSPLNEAMCMCDPSLCLNCQQLIQRLIFPSPDCFI